MNPARLYTILRVNLGLCIREISGNRLRSFITSLGIFLGVASLLVNLSFIRALDDDVQRSMERVGGLDVLTIKEKGPVTPEERIRFRHAPKLTFEQVQTLLDKVPNIKSVIRMESPGWRRVTSAGESSGARVYGVDIAYLDAYNYTVEKGRSLISEDMDLSKPVCLIGKRLAERLFGEKGDPLGKEIVLQSTPFTVVGTIHTSGMHNRRSMEMLFPYPVYRQKFGGQTRGVDEVSVVVKNTAMLEPTARKIVRELTALHRGIENIEIEISKDKILEMRTAQMGMQILLWSIALISLLVGGVSVMNIMFATIGDRIREIGLRKALGARRYDIFMQFIIEATLLCFVGGIPGMMVGAAITLAPEDMFPMVPRLTDLDYILGVLFIVFSGFMSGMVPAFKAARMEPVTALRY